MVRYIYQDNDTDLWIGTQNGLYRYNPLTRRHTHLSPDKDFEEVTVRAITKDHQGNLWYSTDKGICCLTVIRHQGKPDTYQFLTKKTEADILFHVRAIACMPNGQMLFGTSKGLFQAFLAPDEARGGKTPWFLSPSFWNVLVVLIFVAILWLLYRRNGGFHRGRKTPPLTTDHIEPSPLSISSLDQQLLDQATRIVEEHIDDTDFSVEELSTALGMSRAYLYKRLTALAGISPREFIRVIRMKRGKQYLDQSGEAVSQIAWKVGLSPKQFAKYFKDEYGVLPSQYLKQKDAATAE
ncbi:MAG: helix-turn-helix domain-containing protein [Prevotella sp.]|nr:helix-turn-helix domain-containing protein [Prevotella sp.]